MKKLYFKLIKIYKLITIMIKYLIMVNINKIKINSFSKSATFKCLFLIFYNFSIKIYLLEIFIIVKKYLINKSKMIKNLLINPKIINHS
jgi:hypothetical protein